ncbi:uncharacterized protein EAF02_010740 [Botrytis sinoallii]|uniref:uncharacterized protein n=1 Tax=Botrytis sinoallii TaxID=1463999 RepID=UPI0019000C96|nr:uncharacterized protein EAF02_010740 [Botrytis sinoallii]KAF7860506.1 hypothetical protein EAF02_010740 [Botrytis sinoallii]
MIKKISSFYPSSNDKTATSQPYPWKNTRKILVSLSILMSLDLEFLVFYGVYQLASKAIKISGLKQRGKFKFLAFIFTEQPNWPLVGAICEIGELCFLGRRERTLLRTKRKGKKPLPPQPIREKIPASIKYNSSPLNGIEHNIATGSDKPHSYKTIICKPKEIYKADTDAEDKKEIEISSDLKHSESQSPSSQVKKRLFLNFVDFDTKEERPTHLDKRAIADETRSPTFSLSPFHFTKLRSKIPVSLPSSLRSRIPIGGIGRKLKDILENAETTAAKIEAGDKDENEDQDEDESQDEDEMESGFLTPSTSSSEWVPVESPLAPSAHPDLHLRMMLRMKRRTCRLVY